MKKYLWMPSAAIKIGALRAKPSIYLLIGGLNTTEETVCGSYLRVSMKPTAEKLKNGLCEKGKS